MTGRIILDSCIRKVDRIVVKVYSCIREVDRIVVND